ncbi:C-terminal binding protein [Cellulomonas chengniuliangii]|uniref:C-terminal binding protein n=1 Tax=Cellulomonas chengniuliangii TaxID=2968084 RepID=A0ABY5L2S3_9CELL|nr:C-terminal binding protein [Cellulomonas chengniuliangii]MCC2307466.1 C-terminal binding protein [Cellulomonas chengniuliangii]UUI75760.1 C-terminal binding protein [Cellulomonas chengniuliangii]
MRIVITECDHDTFTAEQAVVDAAGADLVLTQSRDAAELVANAAGAQGILVQYAKITAEVMDALPELRAIGRYGVGVDSVDVAAATARGIAVCNVPDYGTEAVSDHAIGMALAVARGIPRLDRGVRAGSFDLVAVRPLYQTRARVFGVVGMGLIGTATARKAAGLGYEVIGYDVAAEPGAATFHGFPSVSLAELLERSQVVSVHVPLTETTRGMIGAAEVALLRDDAIVVNTARGGVIDSDALVEALRSGRIRGAGIDVHETEPIPADDPLTAFDNVVLTPHLAWYTEESYDELKWRTVENVVEVCADRVPRNIVNPEVLGAPGRNATCPPATTRTTGA